MISQREVERRYKEMLKKVKPLSEEEQRVNCYVCPSCNHVTKTKDVDSGTTPFMHSCEACDDFARSTFYNDVAPHLEPTQEWYRPTLAQAMKLRKNEQHLEHILLGGLDVRPIIKLQDESRNQK